MKTIAFKRSSNPLLHKEFIVEYVDASSLTSLDGYETMLENKFKVEMERVYKLQEEHMKKLSIEEKRIQRAQEDAKAAEYLKKKEEEKEYKRFQAWLKHQGNKRETK